MQEKQIFQIPTRPIQAHTQPNPHRHRHSTIHAIFAIPKQSTILLQSSRNLKIKPQCKNRCAGVYRTRKESRAQPFSHRAPIPRLRRNSLTHGLRGTSNTGNHPYCRLFPDGATQPSQSQRNPDFDSAAIPDQPFPSSSSLTISAIQNPRAILMQSKNQRAIEEPLCRSI